MVVGLRGALDMHVAHFRDVRRFAQAQYQQRLRQHQGRLAAILRVQPRSPSTRVPRFLPPPRSFQFLVVSSRTRLMSLEKSRGRRGTVNFVRSARAFDESAGPPHVRLLAASLGAHDLIRF